MKEIEYQLTITITDEFDYKNNNPFSQNIKHIKLNDGKFIFIFEDKSKYILENFSVLNMVDTDNNRGFKVMAKRLNKKKRVIK